MSLSRKAFIGAACALLAFAGAAQAAEDSMDTVLGKALFERLWVSAPSSTKAADGLGPLFNARACSSCHQGGGRAKVSLQEGDLPASAGLTLRVGAAKDGALVPHPLLGSQVQTFAVPGLKPESKLHVTFETHTETLSDGTTVELRRPRIRIDGQDQLADLAWISPRLAPDLHGGGLLERVPLTWLAAQADPDDLDGDGISGSVVMGQYGEQDIEPGRFGWKGDEPDLAHQISAAFHFDLGLSTPLRRALWGDCTTAQADCRAAPQGADKGGVEVETTVVSLVATYLRALPEPASSAATEDTERGQRAVRRGRLRRLPHFERAGRAGRRRHQVVRALHRPVDARHGRRPCRPRLRRFRFDRRRRARVAHCPLVGPGRSCRSEGRRQPAA